MTAVLLASLTVPLNLAEETELGELPSDVRFLWAEYEIPTKVQLRIKGLGYGNMRTFGVIADDRAGVRLMITQDLLDATEANLTPAQITQVRTISTQILSAWITANQRSTDETKLTSEAKLLRLPTLLTRASLISLRQKYEQENGRTVDSIWPCASLLEKRLEEIEEGSFTAVPLSEVISVEEAGDDYTILQEVGSNIKVRKSPKAIPMPASTEELRSRFRTLAISYIVAGYKHGTRLWIKSATMAVFQEYVEFLLSDQVASYSLDQDGLNVRASWTTVLSYDLHMRKLVCRKVLYENLDFASALTAAMGDFACKERYFVTPTAYLMAAGKRPATVIAVADGGGGSGKGSKTKKQRKAVAWQERIAENTLARLPQAQSVAKSKGKAKGKGKGKNRRTPDGRNICSFHNSAAGCTKNATECSFLHVCNLCFAPDHAALACPGQ